MFANDKSIENLGQLFSQLKKYVVLQKEYVRLEFAEKLTVLVSAVVIITIAVILGMMALFYLSFSMVYIMEPYVGGLNTSFAIITGALLLLLAFVYLFRKRLIVRPLTKFVANLFINTPDADKEQ